MKHVFWFCEILCESLYIFLKKITIPNDALTTIFPDSKVWVANMGPNWVLVAPGGPHVGPMDLAIRVSYLHPFKEYYEIHITNFDASNTM